MLGDDPPPEPRGGRRPPRPKDETKPWLTALWGAKLKYEDYVDKKTGKPYKNYKPQCNKPGHIHCEKKRGAVFVERLGPMEPIAFLLAWHTLPWPRKPGVSHPMDAPSEREVDQIFEEHLAAIKDIFERVHQ
jgi:hypothetical protein